MSKDGYVYILTNKRNGTLYVGVTSDLCYRIQQHKFGIFRKSFSHRYGLKNLVYYEHTPCMDSALIREKKLKRYSRAAKVALIDAFNPQWGDLTDFIL